MESKAVHRALRTLGDYAGYGHGDMALGMNLGFSSSQLNMDIRPLSQNSPCQWCLLIISLEKWFARFVLSIIEGLIYVQQLCKVYYEIVDCSGDASGIHNLGNRSMCCAEDGAWELCSLV
jgi:hypothetical protein